MAAALKNHELAEISVPGVKVEKLPARGPDGKVAAGLSNAWIWLDNPQQFNSYTTDMVKARHPRLPRGLQCPRRQ